MTRCPFLSLALVSIGGLAPGCMMADEAPMSAPMEMEEAEGQAVAQPAPAMERSRKAKKAEAKDALMDGLIGTGGMVADEMDLEEEPMAPDDAKGGDGRESGEEAPTRAWFPETFLFQPLVVTDASGQASVELTVPDQLTDWRVLALAHARSGAQAGSTARFSSTLPVYLDVVAPPPLRVGDRLQLPLQVVNNQGQPFHGALEAGVEGAAARGNAAGALALEGNASQLRYLDIEALRPGICTVAVSLAGADRVERSLSVVPTGRRLARTQGGTLAAPRDFEILAPFGALPGASTLDMVVYPGPMAILAGEMERSFSHADLGIAAYGYALSGYGRDIAQRLGQEIDQAQLRKARLVAYQRLVRHTRSPGVQQAVVALAAARTQPEDALAEALTSRLVDQVVSEQSADGSFASAWSGGQVSIGRALVFSALAAHFCRDHNIRVRQRAAGFAARNARSLTDPYTAAVLLAAGLVEGPLQEQLQQLVREAVKTRPDGSRVLEAAQTSQRIDGHQPSDVEVTAWAALALKDSPTDAELVSDLAASLLGAYRPGRGFGDGLAGLAALEALAAVFSEPLPETVQLRLSVDGRELMTRDLQLAGGYAPLVARAAGPARAGPHSYRLEAKPAVPGLAFSVTQTSWLPWKGEPGAEGFALRVDTSGPAAVGESLDCQLQAAVPGGEAFTVELELPAGVEVETMGLDALVTQGALQAYSSREGHLELTAPAMPGGSVFKATVELVPTLAGEFQWGGAALALASDPAQRVQSPVQALRVGLR